MLYKVQCGRGYSYEPLLYKVQCGRGYDYEPLLYKVQCGRGYDYEPGLYRVECGRGHSCDEAAVECSKRINRTRSGARERLGYYSLCGGGWGGGVGGWGECQNALIVVGGAVLGFDEEVTAVSNHLGSEGFVRG